MTIGELLAEAFGRVRGVVLEAVRGLSEEQLALRPDGRGNSIAWLVWHLTRIQDDHVAGVAGTGQAWTTEGWAGRFGLPFPPAETGYGHTSAQVAAVRVPADLLVGYYEAVHGHTVAHVRGLGEAGLRAGGGRALGSAGHAGRPSGQRGVRRPAASAVRRPTCGGLLPAR